MCFIYLSYAFKKYSLFINILFSLFLFNYYSYACIGARPLAMGGAFVGVADDIHSSYWNPAGLINIENVDITWMRIINNRDWVNYNDFISVAQKIREDIALGVSWILIDSRIAALPKLKDFIRYRSSIFFISYASVPDKEDKSSFGINLKRIDDIIYREALGGGYDGFCYGIDLSLLYKLTDKINLGILLQNANEPTSKIEIEGKILKLHYPRNTRVGITFHSPDDTIYSLEIYNLFPQENGETELRIGLEKYLGKIALRYGLYGDDFFTTGIGYKGGRFQIDLAAVGDMKPTPYGEQHTYIVSIVRRW